MERFLNVLLGILQTFLKLSKTIILTRSCFWSKYLDQNLHFHCHNLTNYNWNQCHFHYLSQCPTTPYFFFCNNNIQSFQSVIVNDSRFLSLGLLYALGLRPLLIYWGNWLQSYHRGMKVPVSSSRLQPDKRGSHFCISLFNATNNKFQYWLI